MLLVTSNWPVLAIVRLFRLSVVGWGVVAVARTASELDAIESVPRLIDPPGTAARVIVPELTFTMELLVLEKVSGTVKGPLKLRVSPMLVTPEKVSWAPFCAAAMLPPEDPRVTGPEPLRQMFSAEPDCVAKV